MGCLARHRQVDLYVFKINSGVSHLLALFWELAPYMLALSLTVGLIFFFLGSESATPAFLPKFKRTLKLPRSVWKATPHSFSLILVLTAILAEKRFRAAGSFSQISQNES